MSMVVLPTKAKCRFICEALEFDSDDIRKASDLSRMGRWVDFTYNDTYVGHLIFKGFIKNLIDIPTDSIVAGTVFFCEEKDSYLISIPDSILGFLIEM